MPMRWVDRGGPFHGSTAPLGLPCRRASSSSSSSSCPVVVGIIQRRLGLGTTTTAWAAALFWTTVVVVGTTTTTVVHAFLVGPTRGRQHRCDSGWTVNDSRLCGGGGGCTTILPGGSSTYSSSSSSPGPALSRPSLNRKNWMMMLIQMTPSSQPHIRRLSSHHQLQPETTPPGRADALDGHRSSSTTSSIRVRQLDNLTTTTVAAGAAAAPAAAAAAAVVVARSDLDHNTHPVEDDVQDDDDLRLLYDWIDHDHASFHTNYVQSILLLQQQQQPPPRRARRPAQRLDHSVDDHQRGVAVPLGQTLLDWYTCHRRRLPWRGDDPPWTLASTTTTQAKSTAPTTTKRRKQIHHQQKVKPEEDQDRDHHQTMSSSSLKHPGLRLTPYSIWVSETMLQQTRVETVVDYWMRWMDTFPTLGHLAQAPPEKVNAAWAGLGYYSRAQRFHQAAQYCYYQQQQQQQQQKSRPTPESSHPQEEEEQGKNHVKSPLHWSKEDWQELPGIGPYTAGALASRIGGQAVAAVDGNVARVLARLGGVAQSIQAPPLLHHWAPEAVHLILQSHPSFPATLVPREEYMEEGSRCTDFDHVFVSEQSMPRPVAGEINQALMELGATLCRPTGTGLDSQDPWKDCYMSTRIGRAVSRLMITPQGPARLDQLLASAEQRATAREAETKADSRRAPKPRRRTTETNATSFCSVCAPHGVHQILHTILSSLKERQESAAPNFELGWDDMGRSCGHQAFPLPPVKNTKREEVYAVAVLSYGEPKEEPFYLLTKRPDKGLLAGQWEFPSKCLWNSVESLAAGSEHAPRRKRSRTSTDQAVPMISEKVRRKAIKELLQDVVASSAELESLVHLDGIFKSATTTPIQHVFSHIRHTLWIEEAHITADFKKPTQEISSHDWIDGRGRPLRWMRAEHMNEVGVTAGVTKILRAVEAARNGRSRKGVV